MVGSFLVDALMLRNERLPECNRCSLMGLGRNLSYAQDRFSPWLSVPEFTFIQHDIREPLPELSKRPDYWIHAASASHPVAFSTDPVNTIFANVLGARNILEAAAKERVLFLSSGEVYGENRGDTEYFTEDYCGYLNCNTVRAGYPEAKRLVEAICQAYIAQQGADAVILRLPRTYGPAMQPGDSKATAQFIKKAVQREDIVLKSRGDQLYSFAHVADAVSGMLWVLLKGENGRAYNLGGRHSDVSLRALAQIAADYAGTKVVFDIPSEVERKGYSTATKALLDARRLEALGWQAMYTVQEGIPETIDILRSIWRK